MTAAIRSALCGAGALALAACAAAPPPSVAAYPRGPVETPLDPSFDWHALLPAPPGTRLADMPVKLHEVLLFHDAAAAAADPDHADCHGLDAPAPRFAARTPDDYLVCFVHDRLARVEAQVRLDAAGPDAARLFARLCAAWQSDAEQAGCGGRADGIEWHARLMEAPAAAPGTVLAVTLTGSAVAFPDGPLPAAGPP